MFTHLSSRDAFAGVHLTTSRTHPELRWYTPREGRYPETAQEIVLTDDTAGLLGVGVGETVTLNLPHALPLVVVGLTDERGCNDPPAYGMHSLIAEADAQQPPADYSIIVNPATTARTTPGSSGGGVGIRILVKATDPSRAAAVAESTKAALTTPGFLRIIAEPKVASEVREDAARALAVGNAVRNPARVGATATAVMQVCRLDWRELLRSTD